jgi:hypothetical protein
VVTLDSVLTLPAAVAGAVRLGQRGTGDGRGELSGWIVAAPDPNVWSGRAVQEVSATLADAVLHQCIRPLIGACAPGHHGYQRAYDLISGQASNGLLGSPVFACAGKTDPP